MQVAVNKCGFSVDSSAIYAIAENKRLAIDCYEDAYLRDSIICQQEKEIAMQNTVYERLLTANADLQSTVYKQATTLAAEKPKKWRWAGVACGVGFILGLLIN